MNLVSKSKIWGRLEKFVDYILFCEAADQDLNLKILINRLEHNNHNSRESGGEGRGEDIGCGGCKRIFLDSIILIHLLVQTLIDLTNCSCS